MFKKIIQNKFSSGLILGIIIPLISYAALYFLDQALMYSKSVSLTGNQQLLFAGFKPSTLVLMAICFNLIPTYFANKRYMEEFIRGIMVPTIIYSFIWFFYFKDSFF